MKRTRKRMVALASLALCTALLAVLDGAPRAWAAEGTEAIEEIAIVHEHDDEGRQAEGLPAEGAPLSSTGAGEVATEDGTEAIEIQQVAETVANPEGGEPRDEGAIGDASAAVTAQGESRPALLYYTHVQNVGWQDWVGNGAMAGTTGKALRVEALQIALDSSLSGSLSYRAHVQNVGWQDWVREGETAGTTGESLRIEALQITLDGDIAAAYDIWYRVHVQDKGWMAWSKNGATAGTEGLSLRVEAIEMLLIEKNGPIPTGAGSDVYASLTEDATSVLCQAHVQNVGWQQELSDGAIAGTTGQGLRLEGLKLRLRGIDGGIRYHARVEGNGWQDWVENGAQAGTVGLGKYLEAVEIELTGAAREIYDVWYRVHIQDCGWMSWAKDGQAAGNIGYSKRIEAIQVMLAPVNDAQPTSNPASAVSFPCLKAPTVSYCSQIQEQGWQAGITSGVSGTTGQSLAIKSLRITATDVPTGGSIRYCASVGTSGWQDWTTSDGICGDGTSDIASIKIELTGVVSEYYDVWYRTHVANVGWLDWAKNGAAAGADTTNNRVEAYELKITNKNAAAPGATAHAYHSDSMLYGIDVASHQAGINLATVPSDFVIVKATESTGYTNPYFQRWADQTLQLDKKLGIYHFVNASTPILKQAEYFANAVKPYVGRAMLFLDWEDAPYSSVLTKGPAFAKQFLDEVYRRTGVRPLIYMSRSVTTSYNWSAVASSGYELWVAQYLYRYYNTTSGIKGPVANPSMGSNTYCGAWSKPLIYQYTSTGLLANWNAFLDLNVFYGSRSTWDYYASKR